MMRTIAKQQGEKTEYIDKKALLKDIEKLQCLRNTCYPFRHFIAEDIMSCIKQAPAADVVEVKHGQWTERLHDGDEAKYILYHCSICDSPDARKRNYCRECGAKMNRGEDHE